VEAGADAVVGPVSGVAGVPLSVWSGGHTPVPDTGDTGGAVGPPETSEFEEPGSLEARLGLLSRGWPLVMVSEPWGLVLVTVA
jgi:hypothetical protein